MRLADENDFTPTESAKYQAMYTHRSQLEALRTHIITHRIWALLHCQAAVPSLERAEAQIAAAIEEIRSDLALLMGDET